MTAELLPVRTSDYRLRDLRDRHYSTSRPGGKTVGPPGRRLAFVSFDGRIGWLSHWPDPRMTLDGLDAYRCTLFRNEGGARSSDVIAWATDATEREWGAPPADGWLTFVQPAKVASANPGYCFLAAGWERDRSFTHPTLLRLRRS